MNASNLEIIDTIDAVQIGRPVIVSSTLVLGKPQHAIYCPTPDVATVNAEIKKRGYVNATAYGPNAY